MPGTIDGVGLAREIRSRYPNLPVALTTGYSDAAIAAPSNLRILRKPFDTEALKDFIQDIAPPVLMKPSGVPLASSTAGAQVQGLLTVQENQPHRAGEGSQGRNEPLGIGKFTPVNNR